MPLVMQVQGNSVWCTGVLYATCGPEQEYTASPEKETVGSAK